MTRETAEKKLYARFGIQHFYDEQWEAISRILAGERTLMIQKTGFGKSLCYQFPATVFPYVTIVFSPLISLMRDQVRALERRGIRAAYINSNQSPEKNHEVIEQAIANQLKILYIAPERQQNEEWNEVIRNHEIKISMVVVDEAHTISVWGHDFRPAFHHIVDLVNTLPASLPILSVTATATKRTQKDIENQIGHNLLTIRGSLARHNLQLRVIHVKSEEEKMMWLADNLNKLEGCGLLYEGTRVKTEIYSKWLNYNNIPSVEYNAGLDAESRQEIEQGLMSNRWKCIVATNALGMGIDKPDIRFIIHTQMPVSPIHYYQEIGRAGRDGKPASVILFYNDSLNENGVEADQVLPRAFIDTARPAISKYHKVIEFLEDEALSEREIMKKVNLKTDQIRVIKADLIDQGIINEVKYGSTKKYELRYDAPELDVRGFEELRKAKMKDLDSMVQYIYTKEPRMQFLCHYLDSYEEKEFSNCDNTTLSKYKFTFNKVTKEKLSEFMDSYFPLLDTSVKISKTNKETKTKLAIQEEMPGIIDVFTNDVLYRQYRKHICYDDFNSSDQDCLTVLKERFDARESRLTNGYASSFYGLANVGRAIHKSKYGGGGEFPDFLLTGVLRLYHKLYRKVNFDLILYVPPTVSGDLVKNFAHRFASCVNIPISDDLKKVRKTEEQRTYENSYSKKDNVADAFDINRNIVNHKRILLIDDVCVSGATIKEIGMMLSNKGADYITPLVIAKGKAD